MKCIEQDREGKELSVSSLLIFVGKNVKMKRNLPVRDCALENSMLFAQAHKRQIQARN